MTPDPGSVLEELRRSGLALEHIGGNTGKLRLSLDLADSLRREGPALRVLDVGCAGPTPLNLWEPFVPLAGRLRLVGVDVAGLDRAERRAGELGLAVELREASALTLRAAFGEGAFDAVVSTQVLEHLPSWPDALAEMASVLRPGGELFLTCDSGDRARPPVRRLQLSAKRLHARLRARAPMLARLTDRLVTGEWERGPTAAELRAAAGRAGLSIESLAHYALSEVKDAERYAASATRQLWLAFEETLAAETARPVAPGLYSILYLRARRPGDGSPGGDT